MRLLLSLVLTTLVGLARYLCRPPSPPFIKGLELASLEVKLLLLLDCNSNIFNSLEYNLEPLGGGPKGGGGIELLFDCCSSIIFNCG